RTHDLRSHLAALAACSLLVSADTGPAHMATALGVPRVTIYGPTNPIAWNPGIPTARWVRDPARRLMTTKERTAADDGDPGITGVAAADVLARVRELLAPRLTTIPATPGVPR
ncbi:MAG TPA: glycosyltransferase family 9 protein, partial [Gemmatimonadaceae bacterium]|nr:glycosyltransferase family 9 protein [Gemmatimonadaceae bacterium]